MEQEIKVGSVVVLKSGSPPMTVTSINKDDVRTTWFEGSEWGQWGALRIDGFLLQALTIYVEPVKP